MELFRKKETTHFERDEEGRVVQVTRNGQEVDTQELKMKTSQQLEREYYKRHPEKHHPTLKKMGAGVSKLDKKIVEYNRRGNMMNTQRTGRPVRHATRSKLPSDRNANPFGSMFDTGMTSMPRSRKKVSKTEYAVVGGKAYPIAGTGKHKTKKKTTKKRSFGYDPFDNWGLMK